ncbi:MAG: AmmeMemoRadiSam system protein B [Candidatus Omnitrophica bacterium]|nr:AmmeMemoRadiSam system protein B [Candidatus Omnitrophota bacterium]MBU4590450.1 AmmeMemoRadiSam system protein B [Candidatus Omnitrophota bacterium]
MIRKPVVAGQFYPQTETGMIKMLSKMVEVVPEKQDVKGVIMPHAGYVYSGYVAGATISKVDVKKTAIILGTNHTGAGKPFSIMTKGSWETPLGEVKIDTEISESILKESSLLEEDSLSHLREHSIEVEVPFLQYLRKDVKIVPIVISSGNIKNYQQLGKEIADGFKKIGRAALFIASTDFTHYESKDSAEEKDRLAINAILALDEERLLQVVRELSISMCGVAPTCTLISVCKNLGAQKAGLVKYQTSGDVSGDYTSVVGYAGMVIW